MSAPRGPTTMVTFSNTELKGLCFHDNSGADPGASKLTETQ